MKFSVARDVLSESISWVARVIPNRPASPILTGVKMSATGDTVTLSSFDYEISAHAQIAAEVTDPGEVLVSGRLLADICKALPAKPVEIELDGTKVSLVCGSSRFSLAMMPIDEYPLIPQQPTERGTVDSQVFSQAVSQVSIAASKDETLPTLTGVRVEISGDTITLTATDRYRLAVRDLQWDTKNPEYNQCALVKAKVLSDVAKSVGQSSTVVVGLSNDSDQGSSSLIGFEVLGKQTTSTLMDGDYPPVARLFPESTPTVAVCSRQELLDAVRRVSLVAERKTPVRLSFSEGQVVLEAGQGDNAQASEAIGATLTGEDITTGFNPTYLMEGLSVVDTEFVRFGFTHATKPVVMVGQATGDGQEDTHFRYLLMPIRFGV